MQFDNAALCDALGDLYSIQCVVLDPSSLGWPVVRKRKYSLLRHKFKTGAFASPLNEFSRRFLNVAFATASLPDDVPPWDCFFVARPDELLGELLWAAQRPMSQYKDRSDSDDDDLDPNDSTPSGAFWLTLTETERSFLQNYLSTCKGMVVQLNQNPLVTGVSSTFENLATIIKNAGILWCHVSHAKVLR